MSALSDYLSGKRILILGMGREGRSSLAFLQSHVPDASITLADKNDPKIEGFPGIYGEDYLSHLADFDVVLKSPGIPFVGVEIPNGTEITCQTDLFLRFAPCTTVGITGTKGKTTTSTLIHEVLSAAEIPNFLVGNIGVPVLDVFDESEGKVVVMELSCHQLEFMRRSPHISVFTNLYPEHLDHYDGFEGYARAKLNIASHQTEDDFLIYGDVEGLREFLSDKQIRSVKIPVGYDDGNGNELLTRIANCNERLPGKHNAQNTFFAAHVAKCLGISDDALERGIRNFGGIAHRMEPVGTFKGIRFINDSIATAPEVVLLELEAVKDVDTLLFGGLDRGLDYTAFEKALSESPVQNLIGLPETGHAILDRIASLGCSKNLVKASDMQDAVESAYRLTAKGKCCLFSPAAASYNYYKNFEAKGEHFKNLVRSIGEM